MARINLLPWRDTRRKERERRFYISAVLTAAAMVGIIVYSHMFMEERMNDQRDRNKFLEAQIANVDKEIAAIKTLEKDKERLLKRMNVIQELQGSRAEVVHLFEELVNAIPEGAQLLKIEHSGAIVNIEGVAESNARVSAFMRNLDKSPWLKNPELIVIDSSTRKHTGSSWFSLKVQRVQAN